jgi:1-acyl-sn-glycerol-3-phosphate acyltransferase
MAQLRAVVIFAGFVAGVIVYVPAQLVMALVLPRRARVPSQVFFQYFKRLAGIRVECHGAPLNSGEVGGYLLLSNHVSYFDVAALGPVHPMAFVAKSEVAGWPVIGWLAGLAGTVFVNRKSRIASARDKRAIAARLDRGEAITLFPEGTSTDGQRVLPFKSALLGSVDETSDGRDVWVQPVSLAYTRNWGMPFSRRTRPFYAWYGDMDFVPHKWAAYVQGPFEIIVRFHPPVRRSAFATRKDLAKWAEAVVRAGIAHDLAGRDGAPVLPPIPEMPQAMATEAVAAE